MAQEGEKARGGWVRQRVLGVLVAAVGLLLIFGAWPYFARDFHAWDRYVPVSGRVVGYRAAGPADDVADRGGRIDYTYAVDGERFAGRFPPKLRSNVPREAVEALLAPKEPGEALTVYHDPEEPEQHTLALWIDPVNMLVIELGASLVLGGALLAAGPKRREWLLRELGGCQPEKNTEWVALALTAAPIYIILGLNAEALPWGWACIAALIGPVLIPPVVVFGVTRWLPARLPTDGAAEQSKWATRIGRVHQVIAAGVCLCLWGIVGVFAIEATRFWGEYAYAAVVYEKTQGEVLVSWSAPSTARRSRHVYPHVWYRYSVAGREYQGDRVFFGSKNWGESKRLTDELERRFKPGAAVVVYYNPRAPAQAVLEKTVPGSRVLLTVLVIPCLVVCAAVTIGVLRAARVDNTDRAGGRARAACADRGSSPDKKLSRVSSTTQGD